MDRASSGRSTDSLIERKDWLVVIEDGLKQHAQSKRAGPKPKNVMYQVRRELKELKPEDYVGEKFSFGLFNRSPKNANKSLGQKCKIAMFRAVLDALGTQDWFRLCKRVVPKPEEIQDLYDEPGRDDISMEEIQIVLALDAVFLACFLGLIFYPPFAEQFPILANALDAKFDLILKPLTKDLFKVENQIPLSLIRNVLDLLVQTLEDPFDQKVAAEESLSGEIFSAICSETVASLSDQLPGWSFSVIERNIDHPKPIIEDIPFEKCTNFLDCMYCMICLGIEQQPKSGVRMRYNSVGCTPCLRVKQGPKRSRGTMAVPMDYKDVSLPSATRLHEAGFTFRGRIGKSLHIEFEAGFLSATLYLPTLKLSGETEIMWRNLVAYEDCQNCGQDFIHYVEFMNNLIGSENDVIVLKSGESPVILADTLGTNQTVAGIFNNAMLQTSLRGPKMEKWILLQNQIYEFHNRKDRQLYLRPSYEQWPDKWRRSKKKEYVSLNTRNRPSRFQEAPKIVRLESHAMGTILYGSESTEVALAVLDSLPTLTLGCNLFTRKEGYSLHTLSSWLVHL